MKPPFISFPKMPRFRKQKYVITEKIDGTNGVIHITDNGEVFAGSRNRWLTPTEDNHGFYKFVIENIEDLKSLGPGYHFGEWFGLGIQRGYELSEKRFALFNIGRWNEETKPKCCYLVPHIDTRQVLDINLNFYTEGLRSSGSLINNFKKPEGICIYNTETKSYFKMLLENDEGHKGELV